jgi:microsomal epoxide hydrolase
MEPDQFLEDSAARSPLPGPDGKNAIEPFQIPFDAQTVRDLKHRLRWARWSDAITNDWMYGTESEFLRAFVSYWADRYDWEARVAALNSLPHYRARIDGFGIHFLHFRSERTGAIPLLLMNGWPSSFVEYLKLAPRLASGSPAFDVVLPALPGFGYSDRPTRPYEVEPADLFPALMQQLGYERFLVAGTDIGSGVATRIALRHGERVIGAHIGTVAERPPRAGDPPFSDDEIAYHERDKIWDRDEGGYQTLQRSKPQTLAFALADSPVGLASWILEKFRGWSDCGGDPTSVFPGEMLADNLSIYWMTNTIGSSVRYYYDALRLRQPLRSDDFVSVPTAVGMWPEDIAVAPRALAQRLYNVCRYTLFRQGGHFPAWEQPELYGEDLRAFATGLSGIG